MDREKLYDLIYDRADKLFKKYNPCNIHINNIGKLVCSCWPNGNGANRLCCNTYKKCKYYAKKGCTTKCLPCKLYYCTWDNYSIKNRLKYTTITMKEHKIFRKKLSRLLNIARKYRLATSSYFKSKEEIFENELQKIN